MPATQERYQGLIPLAHSSLDRVLCNGLKHPDSFQHTHLGRIGTMQMELVTVD
jgi:hypothetical protein